MYSWTCFLQYEHSCCKKAVSSKGLMFNESFFASDFLCGEETHCSALECLICQKTLITHHHGPQKQKNWACFNNFQIEMPLFASVALTVIFKKWNIDIIFMHLIMFCKFIADLVDLLNKVFRGIDTWGMNFFIRSFGCFFYCPHALFPFDHNSVNQDKEIIIPYSFCDIRNIFHHNNNVVTI